MSSNIINSVAYLRTSREFPNDPEVLSIELEKAYIDIANVVNARTIGLFAKTAPAITGNQYFIANIGRQQSLRQAFLFSDSNLTITHGIKGISNIVNIYGTFTDGTYWYSLPFSSVVLATSSVNVKVNSTQIIITKGAGAPPTISSGTVFIEWTSNP